MITRTRARCYQNNACDPVIQQAWKRSLPETLPEPPQKRRKIESPPHGCTKSKACRSTLNNRKTAEKARASQGEDYANEVLGVVGESCLPTPCSHTVKSRERSRQRSVEVSSPVRAPRNIDIPQVALTQDGTTLICGSEDWMGHHKKWKTLDENKSLEAIAITRGRSTDRRAYDPGHSPVLEAIAAERTSQDTVHLSSRDTVPTLGPAIPPPSEQYTPPEFVPDVGADPDFARKFASAWRISEMGEGIRKYKYGAAVAAEYRSGFTPEEHREEWQRTLKQHLAEAEIYSDSD